jgi:hypothetical protein
VRCQQPLALWQHDVTHHAANRARQPTSAASCKAQHTCYPIAQDNHGDCCFKLISGDSIWQLTLQKQS